MIAYVENLIAVQKQNPRRFDPTGGCDEWMIVGTPEGTVIRQAPRITIETLVGARLKPHFSVETTYPACPQSVSDENGADLIATGVLT
jgi:hypothetical protein